MVRNRYSKYLVIYALLGAIGASITPTALAQSNDISELTHRLQWQPPPPPPTLGEPGSRGQGAGSRDDPDTLDSNCKDYQFVTPITPRTPAGLRWGQTTAIQPNLWIYTHRGFIKNIPVEVRLLNQQGRTLAKRRIRPQPTPAGLIAIPFPELSARTTYWWELAVYCSVEFPDVPLIRRGIIQRIKPDAEMAAKLQQISDPVAQTQFYASQGLWFDALDTIGTRNITAETRSLLLADLFNQSNLSGLATAPFRH